MLGQMGMNNGERLGANWTHEQPVECLPHGEQSGLLPYESTCAIDSSQKTSRRVEFHHGQHLRGDLARCVLCNKVRRVQ